MKTATLTVALALLCLTTTFMPIAAYSSFSDNFYINFGNENTNYNDGVMQLGLTTASGSGFESSNSYLYGNIAMKIKLISGNSAGTVTSYYLSSNYSNHCELDFEFLGNVSGQPYILQTNVFANGVGDREQRITLWFDPSTDFHTYGILWNAEMILFFVDDTPIRLFQNARDLGVPYLDYQEMYIYSSLWDGSSWATRGGLDKADWSEAPFVASYTDFDIEACPLVTNESITLLDAIHGCYNAVYSEPYGYAANQTLTSKQWDDLRWIQTTWLTYDYCTDNTRWTIQPPECARNWPTQ